MAESKILAHLDEKLHLMPAPEVAFSVIDATGSPDLDADDLESIVLRDAALTAQLLRIANSAYYGLRREVGRVRHAIVLLGFRTTRNMALTAALGACFTGSRRVGSIAACDVWRHSQQVAIAAEALARHLTPPADPDDAFLAGLLHDLGILVEFEHCPDELACILDLRAAAGMTHLEAERHVLGTDHGRINEVMLRRWALPQGLQEASANHHMYECGREELPALVRAVALAEAFAAEQEGFSDGVPIGELAERGALNGDADVVASLSDKIQTLWQRAQTWNET